jgi:DNA-binding NtrC family response regulator
MTMPLDSRIHCVSGQTAHVHNDPRMRVDQILIGHSAAMAHVRGIVEMVAPTTLPVLIQGPTGAGKEVVATALHALGQRRGALVAFNVCAIGDSVFEDALFGHVRGAFTGAVSDSAGLLREADGGTLFLDEVSGLPLTSQAKLLRAIETRRFRPVGARFDVSSDFRVIAATNERITDLVASGRFREDLAHRLGAVVIEVPALRSHVEDLRSLALHFLQGIRADLYLDSDALALLEQYPWPGNIRELKQVLEWAAIWSGASVTRHAVATALATRFGSPVVVSDVQSERQTLLAALERTGWDTKATATALDVHRATVYRLMRRYALSPRQRSRPLMQVM